MTEPVDKSERVYWLALGAAATITMYIAGLHTRVVVVGFGVTVVGYIALSVLSRRHRLVEVSEDDALELVDDD